MSGADGASPWWSRSRHDDRRPFLLARREITRAVRAWFDEQGFLEVETGILQVSPGNETHLHAPCADLTRADGGRVRRYLRTSPEFACKKLLAAGEQRIFELARVFRDRERGGFFFTADYATGSATCQSPTGPCERDTPGTPWHRSAAGVNGPGGMSVFRGHDGRLWTAFHAWGDQVGYGAGGRRAPHVVPLDELPPLP